jgi:LPXTG-site transpeptidase (sortase) family protein
MSSRKQTTTSEWLAYGLLFMGIVIIGGSVTIWLITRLPDQIAVQTAPTPQPFPEQLPTAPVPLSEAPAIVASTTEGDVLVLPVITAVSQPPVLPTVTPQPTAVPQNLPSEASMADAPTSLRLAVPGQPQRLVIPALGVDAPIRDVGLSAAYDTTAGSDIFYEWQVPQSYAVGWHHTSAPLGQTGNTVLNGHQNVFGEVFRDLEDLALGDGIIVYDDKQSYVYEVVTREILPERDQPATVREANARWIEPTADERLTLVTCWPYTTNSHRLVIVARPVDS